MPTALQRARNADISTTYEPGALWQEVAQLGSQHDICSGGQGYVLQQQTVRSLQTAIQLKSPYQPVPTFNPVLAKHFGRPPGHSFYDKYLASNKPRGGWAKVAYVQLLRTHMHVCNAVMAFAALETQASMAQRIIIYPKEWDRERGEDDRRVANSRRLLREAASRYKVMLVPIDPIPPISLQEGQQEQIFSDEEKYPFTNLLSLINFHRIIYLQPSGLILDASLLDLLFTLPSEDKPMLGFTSPLQSSADRPAILLIEPSNSLYRNTAAALPDGAYPDLDFISLVSTTPVPSFYSAEGEPRSLLAETSSLHNRNAQFNATLFLQTTGYIHFQDVGTKGPEFDMSRDDFMRAAPGTIEGRSAWEGVYDRYRERRREVCGLDLEPVESETIHPETDKGEVEYTGQSEEPVVETLQDTEDLVVVERPELSAGDKQSIAADTDQATLDIGKDESASKNEDLR
ncbi:MAG: hypothetical protein Q9163_003484 [Psora crenata]